MKKALVALALFAAGIAAADVTSSNIVGYQKIAIPAGYAGFTPTFVSIGGGDIKLGDIVPSQEFIDDMGLLQFFSQDGRVSFKAYYYEGDAEFPAGWYDFDNESDLNEVTISAGFGCYVAASSGGTLTVKGEVALSDTVVNLATGYQWVGNATPATITLKDLVPSQEFIAQIGTLQFFTADGKSEFKAYYYEGDEDFPAGWFDFDNESDLNGVELSSGKGVLASAPAGGKLTIKAPTVQ